MAYLMQGTPVLGPGGTSNSWSDSVSQSNSGSSGSSFSSNNLPGWYTDYMKGLTSAATQTGKDMWGQPLPQKQTAGATGDQDQAFQMVRDAMGNWKPMAGNAGNTLGQVVPTTDAYAKTAMGAVDGPSRNWTSEYPQYMSPYTMSVVDNIARLGQRNFEEKLTPAVNNAFIGSGQFGSTRNAEILGRTARDAAADTLGLQKSALESGYKDAAGIFASDADRTQRQQQLQANTALSGGKLMIDTLLSTAQQEGALAQALQKMAGTDAAAMLGSGTAQQGIKQQSLDTDYANASAAYKAPLDLLSWAKSIISGVAAPTESGSSQSAGSTSSSVSSSDSSSAQPGSASYTASPLSQLTAAYKLLSGDSGSSMTDADMMKLLAKLGG